MFVVDLCLTSLWLEFAGFWWELRFVRRECDSVTVWQCDPTMTGTRTRENRYAGRYQRADWTEDWMLMTRLTWDDRMTPGCWMTTWHTVMPSQCQHTDGASNLNKIIQNYTKADWDLQQLPNTCQPSSPTSQLPSRGRPLKLQILFFIVTILINISISILILSLEHRQPNVIQFWLWLCCVVL